MHLQQEKFLIELRILTQVGEPKNREVTGGFKNNI